MIDNFERFYRAEKGQIVCTVTSAKPLDDASRKKVENALLKRAGAGAELIVSYEENPAIKGGLSVKMGESVLDFTVATKLERLTAALLEPIL